MEVMGWWVGERVAEPRRVDGDVYGGSITNLGEEELAQRRQRAGLRGEVVGVELKVDEALHALGVVAEAPLVNGLVLLGDRAHRVRARQLEAAVGDHGVQAALHLRARRDGAKRRARETEEGNLTRRERGEDRLLVEKTRVLGHGRNVLHLQA